MTDSVTTEKEPMPPGNFSAYPLMPPLDPSGSGSAGGYPYPEDGLTKRELFAAMAMQGIRASGDEQDALDEFWGEH